MPAAEVMAVAERENAVPYDVKDVELGHHGKECSFDAVVKKYNLDRDPAMNLLAKIVNGADTDNTLWHQPEAAGAERGRRGISPSRLQGRPRDQCRAMDRLRRACMPIVREMIRRGKPDGFFT